MRTRSHALIAAALVCALFAVTFATGCALIGGGANDRSEELMKAWAASPAAADWDLKIRGVIGQSKSTGSHDAPYTIYLTSYESKKVPGFVVYQTIDMPNDDSMDFPDRVGAFFTSATDPGSSMGGLQDPESFMKWYAANMKGKYLLRLRADYGADGKPSYTLVVADAEPTASTTTEGGTETPLTYDEAKGTWATK